MPAGAALFMQEGDDPVDAEEVARELSSAAGELMNPVFSEAAQYEAVEAIQEWLGKPGVDVEWALGLSTAGPAGISVGEALRRYRERPDASAEALALLGGPSARVGTAVEPEPAKDDDFDAALAAAREMSLEGVITVVDGDEEDEVCAGGLEGVLGGRDAAPFPVAVPPFERPRAVLPESLDRPVDQEPGGAKIPGPKERLAWTPGGDCRGFIDNNHAVPEQCQVMLANAMTVLRQALSNDRPHGRGLDLQAASTMQLVLELASRLLPCPGAAAKMDPCMDLVARMLRVSAKSVGRAYAATATLVGRSTRPRASRNRKRRWRDQGDPMKMKRIMVRQCLANAVQARGHSELVGDLARLDLAEVALGDKYLQRWFASVVEYVGGRAMAALVAAYIHKPMPAFGIPSDLELFFDPGTIGKVFKSVRSTVVVTGVTISTPGQGNGSTPFFVGAPPHSVSPEEETPSFMMFLESSALGLTQCVLRSRLAITTTDGAYADGEESHHTPSSDILTKLWDTVGLPAKIGWDEFHRWNKVFSVPPNPDPSRPGSLSAGLPSIHPQAVFSSLDDVFSCHFRWGSRPWGILCPAILFSRCTAVPWSGCLMPRRFFNCSVNWKTSLASARGASSTSRWPASPGSIGGWGKLLGVPVSSCTWPASRSDSWGSGRITIRPWTCAVSTASRTAPGIITRGGWTWELGWPRLLHPCLLFAMLPCTKHSHHTSSSSRSRAACPMPGRGVMRRPCRLCRTSPIFCSA